MKQLTLTLMLLIFAACEQLPTTSSIVEQSPSITSFVATNYNVLFVNRFKDTALSLPPGNFVVIYDFSNSINPTPLRNVGMSLISQGVSGNVIKKTSPITATLVTATDTGYQMGKYFLWEFNDTLNVNKKVITFTIKNSGTKNINAFLTHQYVSGGQ